MNSWMVRPTVWVIGLVVALFLISQCNKAEAKTYYTLVSCTYKYMPEYGGSRYFGIYRSQYGNTFTWVGDYYCPASINN